MKHAVATTLFALTLAACGGATPSAPSVPSGGASSPDDAPGASGTEVDPDARTTEPSAALAPDFELETLKGEAVRLSSHFGKDVVLIDFWATFCDPCLAAMPHLDELYKKHKSDGFVILGVSIDGPDSIAQVKAEVAKLGITFPILLDQESRVVGLYNPKTSAPYSVLIARDGSVIAKKEGYTTGDSSQIDQDVAAALAK